MKFLLAMPCVYALLLATGCTSVATKIARLDKNPTTENGQIDGDFKKIIHRDEQNIDQAYAHELDYINARRKTADINNSEASTFSKLKPTSLCLSGGGIRSATFNLGVLQAFQSEGKLKQIDYLSTVSGGGYIGAWYVTHLHPGTQTINSKPTTQYADNGVVSLSKESSDILSLHTGDSEKDYGAPPSQVMHLQGNSRFILNDSSGLGLVKRLFSWAWRWPGGLVLETALHYKPTRGQLGYHSPIAIYETQLRESYLQQPCESENPIYLQDINPTGSAAPYLILNSAASQGFNYQQRNLPFEFSRDFCGAPEYGYIKTPLLDKPVVSVLHEKTEDTHKARYVKLKPKPFPSFLRKTVEPVKLETALAASGAAVDSAGISNFHMQVGMKLMNFNLRYDTRNYSQNWAEWYWRVPDRLREITTERVWDTTHGNTISLSDGNHVENLGVVAMAYRHVPTIIIADASSDKTYSYASLKRSKRYLNKTPCNICGKNFKWDIDIPVNIPLPKPFIQSTISCGCRGYKSDVFYLKSTFDIAVGDEYRKLGEFLKQYKIHDDKFPHKTTAKQWYGYDEFEAYRQLGYKLTKWMLQTTDLDLN